MKRLALLVLGLFGLGAMYAPGDPVRVVYETTVLPDGSGTFFVSMDQVPEADGSCDDEDLRIVSTPRGNVCRGDFTMPFDDLDGLAEIYAQAGEGVQISCLGMADGVFFSSLTLALGEPEAAELRDGTLEVIFVVPGEFSSGNAQIVEGNRLSWPLDYQEFSQPVDILIEMGPDDTCPPEWAVNQETAPPALAQPAATQPEADEEPQADGGQADLTDMFSPLQWKDEEKIRQRMGCSQANEDNCDLLAAANEAAADLAKEVIDQIPNVEAAGVAELEVDIYLVSRLAFRRDTDGELIYPSLHAALPVIVQLGWNSLETPGHREAMLRFASLLANNDDRRYATDHGE
jgi:hypothetical protein